MCHDSQRVKNKDHAFRINTSQRVKIRTYVLEKTHKCHKLTYTGVLGTEG